MGNGMKYQHIDRIHPRYIEQQKIIRDVCKELGLVAFYPDYHGKERDQNTVLIYTPSDHIYNLELEKQGNWSWIQDQYKKPIFTFQNSDINGLDSYEFANFGRLDLRGIGYSQVIKGAIRYAFYRRRQDDYISLCGGVKNIKEADEIYNDLNRSILDAFNDKNCGGTFTGKIYDTRGLRKYELPVYNFDCDFAVPKYDEELDSMVKEFTTYNHGKYTRIMERIEKLQGITFIWF